MSEKESKTKDKKINIRLDEETYSTIKRTITDELNTDFSAYCRALLSVTVLYEKNIQIIQELKKKFPDTGVHYDDYETDSYEFLADIKSEHKLIGQIIENMKNDRDKFNELVDRMETFYSKLTEEAISYSKIYNDRMEEIYKDEVEIGFFEEDFRYKKIF